MKITTNTVVDTEYELYIDGDDKKLELVEQTTSDRPLNFIYGVGMMLPKFEEYLANKEVGETYEFSLTPEEAYGEYSEEAVIDLARSIFELDGKLDENTIFAGNSVPLMDNDGNKVNALIVSIDDEHVRVDLNHPLAGDTLHFKGRILTVRDATQDDIDQVFGGHSCSCGNHDDGGCGCGGHDDGGCGCGSHDGGGSCGCGH